MRPELSPPCYRSSRSDSSDRRGSQHVAEVVELARVHALDEHVEVRLAGQHFAGREVRTDPHEVAISRFHELAFQQACHERLELAACDDHAAIPEPIRLVDAEHGVTHALDTHAVALGTAEAAFPTHLSQLNHFFPKITLFLGFW